MPTPQEEYLIVGLCFLLVLEMVQHLKYSQLPTPNSQLRTDVPTERLYPCSPAPQLPTQHPH